MFEYFYHEIFRRTIISFGTLFNNILVKKFNDDGEVTSVIKVPLAYAPTQKFLARLEQQPDLNKPVQITLPRMSFEFVGLTYDTERKLPTTQTFLTTLASDKTQIKKAYMPAPWNMEFELSIFCKYNDDMLQIIEQIIPYFQPSYTLTVDLVKTIGEKRDIPVVLNSISMQDNYEGDFTTRRALIYTLRFIAKTYLFGPVNTSVSQDIIKKVSIGFVSGDSNSLTRDITYSQEPLATKSYSNNVVTNTLEDIDLNTTTFEVNDASGIPLNSFITIDEETLKVVKKSGNQLTVIRGSYTTPVTLHVSGSDVKLITEEDNQLIELGDNFGFGDSTYE